MIEYTASERLKLRLMQARSQSTEAAIARQQAIDTTPAALTYQGYNVERQQAKATTDGGTVYVPVVTNGAIATGTSIIGSGGVIDGRPRVIRQEVRGRSRQAPIVALLFSAFQSAWSNTVPVEGGINNDLPLAMPRVTLYLTVNNKTITLLDDIEDRIGSDVGNTYTPFRFAIVSTPRPAVVVQLVSTALERFEFLSGDLIDNYNTYTPIVWHTWIVDPFSGRMIAQHAQTLGNRTQTESYRFSSSAPTDEVGNFLAHGWTPKPIEYPSRFTPWQKHLATSAEATFDGQPFPGYYQIGYPQSWAAGFVPPNVNPIVSTNQSAFWLRTVWNGVISNPSLPALFGSSPIVSIAAAPLSRLQAANYLPLVEDFQQRSRVPLRTNLIADYPVFSRWGYDLDTKIGLLYPFGTIQGNATVEQYLTAAPTDNLGSYYRQLIFGTVQIPGQPITERRPIPRYFTLLNALGMP